MDEKELEKEIEKRKKQIEKKRIDVKAMTIARYLGFGSEGDEYTDKKFKDDNFSVHYFWKKSYVGTDCELNIDSGLVIQHRTKIVFQSAFSNIYCYIPGDWEKELEKLYCKAKEVAEQNRKESEEEEKKSKDKRIKEERKNWGL